MKKLTTFFTMALIALMSLTLTSCDEDADIASTLHGTWRGNMYVEYQDHDAVYSVISFEQEGLYSGSGHWVDYYQGKYWGGNDYIANNIRWRVENGNIRIQLLEEGREVIIYDYSLNDRKFSGIVEVRRTGSRAAFNLTRDSYNYNWRDFDWGYSKIGAGINMGDIPSRSASASKDSLNVTAEPAK